MSKEAEITQSEQDTANKIAEKISKLRETQSVMNKLIESQINDILGEEYTIVQQVHKIV